jgi:lysophospholipid acyltransferase (LPLAT)-like uncharacterized protein
LRSDCFDPHTAWLAEEEDVPVISSGLSLQGRVLAWYAGLAASTATYQTVGTDVFGPTASTGDPVILAHWHGMIMMVTGYYTRHLDARRFIIVVPDDPRGAVLTEWARRWGSDTFALSMHEDSLVAARRLLALIRQMRPDSAVAEGRPESPRGKSLYIIPDGPAGPSRQPKTGVLFIAQRTGAPIVPTAAFTATALHVPRWDRYVVPFPYSRIAVFAGEPLVVKPDEDIDQARAALRERLNDAESRAERLYRTGHPSSRPHASRRAA